MRISIFPLSLGSMAVPSTSEPIVENEMAAATNNAAIDNFLTDVPLGSITSNPRIAPVAPLSLTCVNRRS